MDSQQTALIASRAIARILGGKEHHNFIEYWIGDESDLIRNGYSLSPLFENKERRQSLERIDKYTNRYCPVCQKMKEGAKTI